MKSQKAFTLMAIDRGGDYRHLAAIAVPNFHGGQVPLQVSPSS